MRARLCTNGTSHPLSLTSLLHSILFQHHSPTSSIIKVLVQRREWCPELRERMAAEDRSAGALGPARRRRSDRFRRGCQPQGRARQRGLRPHFSGDGDQQRQRHERETWGAAPSASAPSCAHYTHTHARARARIYSSNMHAPSSALCAPFLLHHTRTPHPLLDRNRDAFH